MTLEQLQGWIMSSEGLQPQLALLARYSAAKSLGLQNIARDIEGYEPDWPQLLFAGSILTRSPNPLASEAALAIAHAGLLYSQSPKIADAGATLLAQLANHRAIELAERRGIISSDLETRVGTVEQLLFARRELEQSLFLSRGATIKANHFQRKFWDELEAALWVSASAPTASGKTYLVLKWLLNQFVTTKSRLAVYIAPTRALVGEIERNLLDLAAQDQLNGIRIASLPLAELGDGSSPTILVFTQERLHVFLNAAKATPQFNIAIVDEAQKLGDSLRGVILQEAIERVTRANKNLKLVFLSPLTENPQILLTDAPVNAQTAVVPSTTATVTQNLILAVQQKGSSRKWQMLLEEPDGPRDLGLITLHARPDSPIKRLSYMALALGRHQTGTLVYANGAAEAEKIAWQIYGGLASELPGDAAPDPELNDLADFARDTVHPEFSLVPLAKRGVAFHYGNMPTLLRAEIERLFREGKVKFLVCTSTLVEGVNLACRTIVMRGPRKGNKRPMGAHDFWNLAGRAGRWGQDFHGNIVCVDINRSDLWPHGTPKRARYPINRETDVVLGMRDELIAFLDRRNEAPTSSLDAQLEQVGAYLLAWRAREGSFLSAPAATRLPADYVRQLDEKLGTLMANIELPTEIITRHPGVSAVALQSLFNYFQSRKKPVEDLIPSLPESDDAYSALIAIFKRINSHMYQAFMPSAAVPVHALVTIEWMKGMQLNRIIQGRIAYLEKKKQPYKVATVIRETMREVEEVARFRAPKYLAAYIDVLKFHLERVGRVDLITDELRFDLYLEFGVATKTLLSLIGIGMSRTSAVAINEFLGVDDMTEEQILEHLRSDDWRMFDLPKIVKREIETVAKRRSEIA